MSKEIQPQANISQLIEILSKEKGIDPQTVLDAVKEAMAELRRMSESSNARLGADYKFDRDSLYDR